MCLPMFPCHFIGNLRVFLLTQFCYVANKMLVQSEVALFAIFGHNGPFSVHFSPNQSLQFTPVLFFSFGHIWSHLDTFGHIGHFSIHFGPYQSCFGPFGFMLVLFSPTLDIFGHLLLSDPKNQICWYIFRLISPKAINSGHYSWLWSTVRPLLLLTGIAQKGPYSESSLDLFCWLRQKTQNLDFLVQVLWTQVLCLRTPISCIHARAWHN